MKAYQRGFTMIELVVVITILGILSAVAAPRFLNMATDARIAGIEGAAGAMRSANAMLYAKAAASGETGATGTLTISGNTVNLVYGFAKTMTDLAIVMDLSGKLEVDSTSKGIIYHGYDLATCGVTYTAATSSTSPGYDPKTTCA